MVLDVSDKPSRADLVGENAKLRARIEVARQSASRDVNRELDRLVLELEGIGDTKDDIERIHANLKERARLLGLPEED